MSFQPDERDGDFEEKAAVEDLSRIHDDDLEMSIVTTKRQIDGLRAGLALRVAEYDRRGLADQRHVLSTKQWLAHRLRMTKQAAASLVRTGRSLRAIPTVAEGAVDGTITADGVRLLTAARQRHPEAFDRHELVFADIASYLGPSDLRRAIAHWEQQVAYPDVVAEIAARRRRRRFSINQTFDGMWSLVGDLDPETGEVVATALLAKADPANLDPDDDRTRPQVMADALADICRFSLDHDDRIRTSGGERPHVSVTVDYRMLARDPVSPAGGAHRAVPTSDAHRLPELSGVPIDPETIRRLSCDAGIVRMVIGPRSEVLDIGRSTRTIPAAIRRALETRDGGCRWAGCDASSSWCDAHHLLHWADGGATSMDNLMLLCRRHHTAIHDHHSGGSDEGPPTSFRTRPRGP